MHLIVRKKTEADLLRLPHVTLQEKEQQLLLVELEMLSSKIKPPTQKKKFVEKFLSLIYLRSLEKELY